MNSAKMIPISNDHEMFLVVLGFTPIFAGTEDQCRDFLLQEGLDIPASRQEPRSRGPDVQREVAAA